jgi:hypothetical protein
VERPPIRLQSLQTIGLIVAIAGVAVLAIGNTLPWGSAGELNRYGAYDSYADGLWAFLCGLALVAVVVRGGTAGSRIRTVQLLPALLGIGTLLLALVGFRAVQGWVDSLAALGHEDGKVEPGAYVSLLGGALAAAGGTLYSWVTVREVAVAPSAMEADADFARQLLVRLLLVIAFTIGGGAAGVLIALRIASGLGSGLVLMMLALIGAAAGAAIGDRIWKAFFAPPEPPGRVSSRW